MFQWPLLQAPPQCRDDVLVTHSPQQELVRAASAQLFAALKQLLVRLYGSHGAAMIVPSLSGGTTRFF